MILLKNIKDKLKHQAKKSQENLINISSKVVVLYRNIIFIFKIKIWPIVKKVLIISFLLFVLIFVAWFIKTGMESGLSDKYQNLFGVLTSTVGTVVAIFFSLILIPLNQIAMRYSPRFLKYLKKDKFFLFVISFSIFSLTYDVFFLFIGSSKMIAIGAIILFILLILFLIASVRHVIKLSDPKNSILVPSHKEIVKTFNKMIPRSRKACEKLTKRFSNGRDNLKGVIDICLFEVDSRITDYIQETLLPIREVAIKAIKDLDLEHAKNAIQIMMSIVVNYLYSRREYHSDNDPLLYFLYTEYKLIAQTASNELKIRLHPIIVDCWRLVGLRAAVVNVKGMKRLMGNVNSLVRYPVIGLKELCVVNLPEMDSYVPGKACDALADIGAQLMKEGYDHQAFVIVEELEKISLGADQYGMKHVSGSANYAIMRIYVAGVSLRNFGSQDPHNYPYRQINRSIDKLLGAFLQKKRDTFDNMILSSFIGYFMDPIKGLNLSRISEFGIFTPDLTRLSLERNLECVKANVRSIKIALTLLAPYKDFYFSTQALENLYRIILNLLSYLNKSMAKDHISFYNTHPFLDESLSIKSTENIIEGLSVFCGLIKSRADHYIFENDHMHIFFSLYLIILYEYKIRPNQSLGNLFDKVHELLCNLLIEYKAMSNSDNNDVLYRYYRLIVKVLNENGFTDLSTDFKVPKYDFRSRNIIVSHESEYPETMFDGQWIIKRPIYQVNTYYFNRIESALKLDTLKFY